MPSNTCATRATTRHCPHGTTNAWFMQTVELPISKSIANRLLLKSAIEGGDLALPVTGNRLPDDTRLILGVLRHAQIVATTLSPTTYNLDNCATAMRFLTAYFADRESCEVILTGCERMKQRPIGQLVDALRCIGADITYLEREGFPSLMIRGKRLDKSREVTILEPLSTQYISALILIGANVTTDCHSPYIDMTRTILSGYSTLERDWSAAAFFYENTALTGKEYFFPALSLNSCQGDKVVAEVFQQLGVATEEINDGILIRPDNKPIAKTLTLDFSLCPDLYPALFATCVLLGVEMQFTGMQALTIKESNRIKAMQQIEQLPAKGTCLSSHNDHRIAMALIAAGYNVDNSECINKSFPDFLLNFEN